jgi:hypothetical protein
MNLKYTLAVFFVICSVLTLRAQKSVYAFPFENTFRLNSMRAYINMEEISASYQTLGNIYSTEITGMGDETMEQVSTTFISDVKALDAVRFLEYYLEEQLLAPGDGSAGLVELSIIYQHEHSRFNAGSLIGILTFGIGTLLGIPYATTIIDVEAEATFYNSGEILIATHRGVGRAKKPQTLYNMSSRKVHQRALKQSIEHLNKQIISDPQLRML